MSSQHHHTWRSSSELHRFRNLRLMPNAAPMNSEPLSCSSTLANTGNERLRAEVAFTGNNFVAVVVFRVKKPSVGNKISSKCFRIFSGNSFEEFHKQAKKITTDQNETEKATTRCWAISCFIQIREKTESYLAASHQLSRLSFDSRTIRHLKNFWEFWTRKGTTSQLENNSCTA